MLSSGEGSLAIALEIQGEIFSPITSSNGHIVALINANTGSLADYSPLTLFGEDLSETPLSPWRFCGKRHYAPNLIDFGFRFYHPKSCQWLNRDPIGEADGPNLYAYVQNAPTQCIDRFGLFMDDFDFSQSWSTFEDTMSASANFAADYTYRSIRFQGGMRAFGGLAEAGLGAGAALGTGGVGTLAGLAVMSHGVDNFCSGFNQAWSGVEHKPCTTQLLESAGLSSNYASFGNDAIGIFGSIGSSAMIRSVATANPFTLPPAQSPSSCCSSVAREGGDWAKLSGMLRSASKEKGNFTIGSATRSQADAMGKAWVGEGYKISSGTNAWISKDTLKQYRPPSLKPRLGKVQANFQRRFEGQISKEWQSNAHLNILDVLE